MPELEALKRQIDSVQDLQSIVKTMKALAAVSIRQYEKAVASLAEYNRTLEMGVQILLQRCPEVLMGLQATAPTGLGIVVFGSDQGMCGAFNDRIAQFLLDQLQQQSLPPECQKLLAVGTRVRDGLEAAGHRVESSFAIPGSIGAIAPMVQDIVLTLETWRQQRAIDQILVFHNQPISSATYQPRQQQLFPLSLDWLRSQQQRPWPNRCLPNFTQSPDRLMASLFRQYFFVSLYRACAASLASENASRLASMQIAEKNIAERRAELQTEFNHQRQTAITEELLDIVSGFEALTQTESGA